MSFRVLFVGFVHGHGWRNDCLGFGRFFCLFLGWATDFAYSYPNSSKNYYFWVPALKDPNWKTRKNEASPAAETQSPISSQFALWRMHFSAWVWFLSIYWHKISLVHGLDSSEMIYFALSLFQLSSLTFSSNLKQINPSAQRFHFGNFCSEKNHWNFCLCSELMNNDCRYLVFLNYESFYLCKLLYCDLVFSFYYLFSLFLWLKL